MVKPDDTRRPACLSRRWLAPSTCSNRWDEFLGKDQTNIDPRTGLPDPDRIWSADGTRSIRFGEHEMNSSPSKLHYHEEAWSPNRVDNVLQRVQK
jgi:hypothetical protein